MDTQHLLEEVEKEIARLQQVADLLRGGTSASRKQGKGRRKMSEEGRKKIAAAQRARWAKVKKEKKSD